MFSTKGLFSILHKMHGRFSWFSVFSILVVHSLYDILACWRRTRTKSGKYGPRELPREPICPKAGWPGGQDEGSAAIRVPAGRILSTGRALWRDLCDKDFVLVRLQQANMCYMPLSRFTGSVECCITIIPLFAAKTSLQPDTGFRSIIGSKIHNDEW